MYLQEAFNQVCKEAKTAKCWYVSLMENRPFYDGPEEGGWWGCDTVVVAYQQFDTEEAANNAKQAVEKLAAELTEESKKDFGKQCLQEMDWLEQRGLDADFLPESDGESDFFVVVSESVPGSRYGRRGYE
jgi:hypothetical protein